MRASRHGRLGLGALLAVLLLLLFFRGVEWAALSAAFRSASPLYLAGTILMTVGTYAARAWRWGFLMAPLVRVPFPQLLSVTLIGFMSGLLVPRAGEVLRPYLVARRHPIKASAGFASIILERLVDLITVLAMFGAYLFLLPAPAQQTRGPLMGVLKAGGAAAAAAAAAVLVVLVLFHLKAERVLGWAELLLSRLPERLARPLSGALRSFSEGLVVLKAPAPHLLAIAAQSALVWGFIAVSIHWSYRAFGVDLPFHASFLVIAFLTVGVSIPTPGNVGGFHETYLLALNKVYGVDAATAAAAGIASHALTNLPVLVLGLALLGREGLSIGKVAEMTETEDAGAAAGEAAVGSGARP